MLSVQSPGCAGFAGMDRLGGLGRSALGGPGVRDRAEQRELKERHQRELSLIMERQNRYHSAQRCDALNYPHRIRLADGERSGGSDRNMKLRAPYQHSELTRTSVQPPPNKSVCDVPGHKEACKQGPDGGLTCGTPPYRSSSSGHLGGCPSSSGTTGDLYSPLVPRSHSVSTPRDKNKDKTSATKKDNIWTTFRQNVLGRFSGNGSKSNCLNSAGGSGGCDVQNSVPLVVIPNKPPMSVLVPVREKDNNEMETSPLAPRAASPGSRHQATAISTYTESLPPSYSEASNPPPYLSIADDEANSYERWTQDVATLQENGDSETSSHYSSAPESAGRPESPSGTNI